MRDSVLKCFLVKNYEKLYDWRRTIIRDLKYSVLVRNYRLRIMSPQRTIRYIIKHNCSITRFGDGEFDLLRKARSLKFQVASDELSAALGEVLDSKDQKLLLCVPGVFNSIRGANYHAAMFWSRWGFENNRHHPTVDLIRSFGKANYLFGDAQITRLYIDWASPKRAEKLFPLLKQLWEARDVLIVEGEKTRLGVGNDLFENAGSIKRILGPAENGFDYAEDIMEIIRKHYQNELIILALGPTATVLAAKLSAKGIQALDLGHIDTEYEWFLAGAKEKQVISGKYVHEVANGQDPTECKDEKYLNQIIARVTPTHTTSFD